MIQLLGIIVFALLLYLAQKYVYAKIWQRDLKVSLSFREDGIWEGQNEINLFPRSLYIAQLMARQKNSDLSILLK